MNSRPTDTEVYTVVFELAKPAPDPSRPDRILRTPGYCCGFADAVKTVGTLTKKFSKARLCKAGVLQRRPPPLGKSKECYDLHPDLASADCHWLTIRDTEGTVHEIVGRSGCISGATVPLFTMRHDSVLHRNLRNYGSLYMTFTVEDAAVLRALGMPAMTATGLATLRRRQLRAYRKLLADGLDVPQSEFDDSEPSGAADPMMEEDGGYTEFDLTLVGWSPATLSAREPTALKETVESLREVHAEDRFGLSVWRQTGDSLAQLVRTIRGNARQQIQTALQRSARQSSSVFPPRPPRPEVSLAHLYGKLDADLASAHPGEWNSIRSLILSQYNERLVVPLRTQAMSSDDPSVAACLVELADLIERQTVMGLELHIEVAQQRRNGPMDDKLADKMLKNRCQLTDRIVKLTEILRKCQPKAKVPINRLSMMFSTN